ncbi:MAG TPA: YjgN family protein, partial [Rheinheimera sp.]|nr:YjgN family protein [Rheinheimera sp.]
MEQQNHAASLVQPARNSKILFSGQAGEYFGIWIVNILLSILTLGIYSAWAKVRTQQYFYGHTKIENQSFRYLATPMQILRGRIIAVVLFGSYFALASMMPAVAAAFAIAMIFVSPWLIVQSLKFNMRVTSYRNVRFAFHGTYGGAFKYFILLPVLAAFTLYLAMPWALRKIDAYIVGNTSYGGKKFSVNTDTSTYYIAALTAFAVAVGIMTVFIIASVVISFAAGAVEASSSGSVVVGFLAIVAYWFVFMLTGAIYHTAIRNHLFNNSQIDGVVRFNSSMKTGAYLALTMTNLLAMMFTLGL